MPSLLPESFQSPLMLEFENIVKMLGNLPSKDIRNFWNADKCRVDLLPYLAKNLGVENFDNTWSEEYKRQVIKNNLIVNKQKGTVASVKKVLTDLNLNTSIKEWFNYNEQRGTARIEIVSDIASSPERQALIAEKINKTKRLACTVAQVFKSAFSAKVKIGSTLFASKNHYIKGA